MVKPIDAFARLSVLTQVNKDKEKRGEAPGYDRHCRSLSSEEVLTTNG